MEKEIKKIKLFINNDPKSIQVGKNLREELLLNGFDIVNTNYDLVISVGGDGSFLRMLKNEKFNEHIYYIGVNAGTLGFLQEIDINDTKNFVKRLSCNDFKIEELSIQKTLVKSNDNKVSYYSLNEIVVRKDDFSILKAQVLIDNELLEKFTGDGLLISTSTGSTAYNMSFGGAIIYNTLKTLAITPIAPLNNKVYKTLLNPLIVPNNKLIKISFNQRTNVFLMVDGVNYIHHDVLEIESKVSRKKIKCIRMNDYHFIKIINSKILENK